LCLLFFEHQNISFYFKAVALKKRSHIRLLYPTEESNYRYKEKRNHEKKTIMREAHQQSWDKFVSNIDDGLYGRQISAHKVIKHKQI
jgi:hypothetical protein